MNVDHLGIAITLIILAVFLSIALLSQAHISILPEIFNTSHNYEFENYCKQLNLNC